MMAQLIHDLTIAGATILLSIIVWLIFFRPPPSQPLVVG